MEKLEKLEMKKAETGKPPKNPEALAAEEDVRADANKAKVDKIAEKLGVKSPSEAEVALQKRAEREKNRTANRLAKQQAEAKMTPKQKRKRLLLARLANPNNQYTKEQLLHYRAELKAMKLGQWFEPYIDSEGRRRCWKLPAKQTAIERFLNS